LGANREHLAAHLDIEANGDPRLDLLFDPQTSGGLLVSLPPEAAERLVAALHADGEPETAVVGRVTAGTGRIRVQRGLG
jgi:selenide,water dikinase